MHAKLSITPTPDIDYSICTETSTLSETSDVGLINIEPVSSTTSVSSDAQAIISVAWRNTTKQNTTVHSKDGQTFVVKGISIHCNQIQ